MLVFFAHVRPGEGGGAFMFSCTPAAQCKRVAGAEAMTMTMTMTMAMAMEIETLITAAWLKYRGPYSTQNRAKWSGVEKRRVEESRVE